MVFQWTFKRVLYSDIPHCNDSPYVLVQQDMGTMVMGKVESGGLAKGMTLTLMPNKVCGDLRSCSPGEICISALFRQW